MRKAGRKRGNLQFRKFPSFPQVPRQSNPPSRRPVVEVVGRVGSWLERETRKDEENSPSRSSDLRGDSVHCIPAAGSSSKTNACKHTQHESTYSGQARHFVCELTACQVRGCTKFQNQKLTTGNNGRNITMRTHATIIVLIQDALVVSGRVRISVTEVRSPYAKNGSYGINETLLVVRTNAQWQ